MQVKLSLGSSHVFMIKKTKKWKSKSPWIKFWPFRSFVTGFNVRFHTFLSPLKEDLCKFLTSSVLYNIRKKNAAHVLYCYFAMHHILLPHEVTYINKTIGLYTTIHSTSLKALGTESFLYSLFLPDPSCGSHPQHEASGLCSSSAIWDSHVRAPHVFESFLHALCGISIFKIALVYKATKRSKIYCFWLQLI